MSNTPVFRPTLVFWQGRQYLTQESTATDNPGRQKERATARKSNTAITTTNEDAVVQHPVTAIHLRINSTFGGTQDGCEMPIGT
ncbi:hypothetical protein A4X03_0g9118 [Tilletia caries]|uniref:Uncharacterized protein n=1 Tax=Tilletia caries TaxID=13290 RepID=A0A177UR56_9BASI|nr:hypothetical protein A4X03_0g9118 [Tilletia caries]